MENRLSKLFVFRVQTIDVSDQTVFILKYLGLNDEEVNKFNLSVLLTAAHRRSGLFFVFHDESPQIPG